jgi:predicted MPP superfamily phosphohydrolase
MKERIVIAHISDLHFAGHWIRVAGDDKSLTDELPNALASDPKPNFVVVTGDLSQWGTRWQLRRVKVFLDKLARALDCRYLVVPGNHDVGFLKKLSLFNRVFGTWGGPEQASGVAPTALDPRRCEHYPEAQVAFLKFDSNVLLGAWPASYARGRVGRQQLDAMTALLSQHTSGNPSFGDARRIALVHHHAQYLPHTGSDTLMLMKDAGDFWKAMLDMDVEVVLHGHKHYPTHLTLSYHERGEDKQLLLVSAGSTTSTDQPEGLTGTFYKIVCEAFRYRVQRYDWSPTSKRFEASPRDLTFYRRPRLSVPDAPGIDMHALELMLVPEDDDLDARHHYTEVDWQMDVNNDFDYLGTCVFRGVNKSTTPSSSFLVPLVVVGAPRLDDMHPEAYDLLASRKRLPEPELTRGHDVNKVRVRVSMDPVLPDGRFEVEIRFVLKGVMYRENDYDAVGLTRFSSTPDIVQYTARTRGAFVEPRLFAVHRARLEDLSPMDKQPNAAGIDIRTKRLAAPKCLGLLFHYRRIERS